MKELMNKEYYVSLNGNNANEGTTVKAPFQTIQYAVDKMKAGDRCYIMEGTYREKVIFRTSGKEGAPIVLIPYQNQKVTVTGLDELSGWSRSDQEGIWQAPMDWDLGKGKNQLFYKGEVMLEARYPNVPQKGLELPVEGLSKLWPTFGEFAFNNSLPELTYVLNTDILREEEENAWKGAIYYGVHNKGWCAQTGVVEKSSKDKITLTQPTSRWWFSETVDFIPAENGKGMLVGHRLALDTEGEWLLEDGKMLFISPSNENPEGKVEVKKRQLAFEFLGVEHIELHQINVKAASVRMQDSEYCKIDGCELTYITHFTLFDDGRNGQIDKLGDDTPLRNGEVAIYISGRHNSITNSKIRFSAGGGIYMDGHNHIIHNNLIDECSYTCTYLPNLMIGAKQDTYSGGHVITYNTLSNSGRALLHFDGKMENDGRGTKYAASLISNNHFKNGVIQGRDGGGIYCFWSDLGAFNGSVTEFYHNVMQDHYDPIGDLHHLGFTYLDNNSQNFHGHHNMTWAKPGCVQIDKTFNPWSLNMIWENNKHFQNQILNVDILKDEFYPDSKPYLFGTQMGKKIDIPKWDNIISMPVNLEGKSEKLHHEDSFIVRSIDFDQNWQSVRVEYYSQNIEAHDNQEFSKDSFLKVNHHRPTDPLYIRASDGEEKSLAFPKHKHSIERFEKDGSWIKLAGIPLGEGYKTLNILYSSQNNGPKWLELRSGSPDGNLIIKVDLEFNGGEFDNEGSINLNPYKDLYVDFPEGIIGTQDLYLVARGDDSIALFQLAQIRLLNYRGESRVNPGERRIELHLDSPEGEKIADVYLTGAENDKYLANVANLKEGINGVRDICFVVKASSENVVVDKIRSVLLEKI